MKRPISKNDVVRIDVDWAFAKTGVVIRVHENTVCVVPKGENIGIWFSVEKVKRIGRIKGDLR